MSSVGAKTNGDGLAAEPIGGGSSVQTSSANQVKEEPRPLNHSTQNMIGQASEKNLAVEKKRMPSDRMSAKEKKDRRQDDAPKLNFYQPSEGSSENLKGASLENDKEDAGEIIF